MLSTENVQACTDAFEEMTLTRIRTEDVKPFCVAFLRELYTMTAALTCKKQELETLRRDAMAAFAGMKGIADLLVLVKEQCRACMELCAHQTVKTAGYVQMIDEYIEKHYSEPDLSVSSISEWLHLSAVYTGTLYKQHKGVSITARINEVRIRHAEELLADVNGNVRSVSRQVGYVTPDYFSRLFSSVHGLSPSQYRVMVLHEKKAEE